MSIKLNGATNGSVELDVPAAIGSDLSVTIPATAGDIVVKATDGSVDLGAIDIAASAPADSVNIDSSGRLLVGTSTARSNFYNSTVTAGIQLEGTDAQRRLSIIGGDFGSALILGLQKSGSPGGNTIVAAGDGVGEISFQGNDGSEFVVAGQIKVEVDGTPGANDMPGRLVFSTTIPGNSSPTERVRIDRYGRFDTFDSSGACIQATSGLAASTSDYIFIGRNAGTGFSTGVACYAVYTNGSFQQLSDANHKKNIETTRNGYLEDLNRLRVVKYNWKSQEDGDPKELGLVAQEVENIFPGLVSEMDSGTENSSKGIKTSVLPYMLIKALQEATERIETLEASNAALEARLTALEGGAS